jgi:hypothetical protein
MLARMTKETEAKWVERVREWRSSGLSAEDFATNKGFEASTLRWAASRLRSMTTSEAETASSSEPRRVVGGSRRRTRSSTVAPRFLPVRRRATKTTAAELLVEVGNARIRVARGFDVSLLGEVVRALGGDAR